MANWIKGIVVEIGGDAIMFSLEKIKVYAARGWLNYYEIASMKNLIEDINR